MSVVEPALPSCLRTLKLSGMLETLDARLAQARAGELGHLEFLQVLCHDEISRRETVAMSRRLRRAHFEQSSTLEGFDFAASPKLPAAQIRDLAALRWLSAGESVILYGPVGVGESPFSGYPDVGRIKLIFRWARVVGAAGSRRGFRWSPIVRPPRGV
jgi:DNA replication protein DnaC